jgi:hypothetical protein
MMSATNIHFEMAERSRALNYGGIGAMHLMGQKYPDSRESKPFGGAPKPSRSRSLHPDATVYRSLQFPVERQ